MWTYLHDNAIRQTFHADISFGLLTGKATHLMKIKREYHSLSKRTDVPAEKCQIKWPLTM